MKSFIQLFLLFLSSCSQPSVTIIETQNLPTDLIPEGIAIDSANNNFYLSSIRLDQIVRVNKDGKEGTVILPTATAGYTIGVGMDVAANSLFALGRINRQKQGLVLEIDLLDHSIKRTFSMQDTVQNLFNDLAIDSQRNAYLTDTEFHHIYRLDYENGTIERWLTHKEIQHPNGIAISDDGSKLFIDSWTNGIRIVDIASKSILNPGKHAASSEVGIDGLKYHKNALYAIRNGADDKNIHGLYRYSLSDDASHIGEAEAVLVAHPIMNIPTTFAIHKNFAFVLANSQLDNLDQDSNEIIDEQALTSTYILKVKLSY